MKLNELIELYPHFTKQQLIRLRTTFNNIKSRCNSKSHHHKHYHHVDFNFTALNSFIDFILSEKEKGRDYFQIKDPNICRIFDQGRIPRPIALSGAERPILEKVLDMNSRFTTV